MSTHRIHPQNPNFWEEVREIVPRLPGENFQSWLLRVLNEPNRTQYYRAKDEHHAPLPRHLIQLSLHVPAQRIISLVKECYARSGIEESALSVLGPGRSVRKNTNPKNAKRGPRRRAA